MSILDNTKVDVLYMVEDSINGAGDSYGGRWSHSHSLFVDIIGIFD